MVLETRIATALSSFDTAFVTSLLWGDAIQPFNNGIQRSRLTVTGTKFPVLNQLSYSNGSFLVWPSAYTTNVQLTLTQPLLGSAPLPVHNAGPPVTAVATEVQYKTMYNIAIAALREATGTLLAERGIVVATAAPKDQSSSHASSETGDDETTTASLVATCAERTSNQPACCQSQTGAIRVESDAEFQAALSLFHQGKLAEAEKQFAKLAEDCKGTTWGEKSLYHLAVSQFQRKAYVDAHSSFERLHAEYPATNYLDEIVGHEYVIAQIWLAQPDSTTAPNQSRPCNSRCDDRQAVIDTQSLALRALEHVRWNDPTGPLAGAAMLQIADYYMRHHDYETASLHYEQFIREFPKSPDLERARLGAIKARMRAYVGWEYDASCLETAREMVNKAFQSAERSSFENLYLTLDLINGAQAEKTYRVGMYYKSAGKVASAKSYLSKILERWPGSPWAVKAKAELAQLTNPPSYGSPTQLPKLANPTTPNAPEAKEDWPMTLQAAIRIGLDNSEIVRVIAFGAQGIPIGSFEPLPPNPGAVTKPAKSNAAPIVIARLNADANPWRFKAEVMAELRSIEQQYWNLAQRTSSSGAPTRRSAELRTSSNTSKPSWPRVVGPSPTRPRPPSGWSSSISTW